MSELAKFKSELAKFKSGLTDTASLRKGLRRRGLGPVVGKLFGLLRRIRVLERRSRRQGPFWRRLLPKTGTLLALGALFVFGGEVIRGFTIARIRGVFVGTYSSVALAVPVLLYLDVQRGGGEPDGEEARAAAD